LKDSIKAGVRIQESEVRRDRAEKLFEKLRRSDDVIACGNATGEESS
jgi:hypothetical protein